MICIINYSIGPYHAARFNELQKKLAEEMVIIEATSNVAKYPWKNESGKVNSITLFPNKEFDNITSRKMSVSIDKVLNEIKPRVVVCVSYASTVMRAAAIWARKNKAISICMNDTWEGDKKRYFPIELLKGFWCRSFYDGLLLSGWLSKNYYKGLGVKEFRIWTGYDCVDNEYFSKFSSEAKVNQTRLRNKYKLPKNYFICVARLSKEKNLERLIIAFNKYKKQKGSWDLVLLGSGPLDQELKDLSIRLGMEKNIHFLGWRQIDEMPIFYGLASCLILPSLSEPWGLAVNEAMASGLPILISNKCGCEPELCMRGVNGFTFSPNKEDEIVEAMLKISESGINLERMGKISQEIIKKFSLENYADSLINCIDTLSQTTD